MGLHTRFFVVHAGLGMIDAGGKSSRWGGGLWSAEGALAGLATMTEKMTVSFARSRSSAKYRIHIARDTDRDARITIVPNETKTMMKTMMKAMMKTMMKTMMSINDYLPPRYSPPSTSELSSNT